MIRLLSFSIILLQLNCFGQFLESRILINEDFKRFFEPGDLGTSFNGSSSGSEKVYTLEDGTIYLVDDFMKVAAFKFSPSDEDTVYIGYTEGTKLKQATVLSCFSSDLLSRKFCTIKSNKDCSVSDILFNTQDSIIALLVLSSGDTLYPDSRNISAYLEMTGVASSALLLYDFDFNVIFASNFNRVRNLIKSDNGFCLYGWVPINDSIELSNGNYWVNTTSSTVDFFYFIDAFGNFLDFIYTSAPNNYIYKQNLFPLKVTSTFTEAREDTYISQKRGNIFSLSNQRATNNHYWNYFIELSESGEFNIVDSVETIGKKNLSSAKRYNRSEIYTQVLSSSDSFSIFRGYKYYENQIGTSGNLYLRNDDLSEYDKKPFIQKLVNYYYSGMYLNLTDTLQNFSYKKDTYHGSNFKQGTFGGKADILSMYDSQKKIIWSRSIPFTNLFNTTSDFNTLLNSGYISIFDKYLYIYGTPKSDRQDLHPNINGNNVITPGAKVMCIYNCRPITYFRALPNDSFKVQFHNLSDMRASFLWNFGDGKTSTEESPLHTFPNKNIWYTVTLYSEDECGKDTFSAAIFIDPVRFSSIDSKPFASQNLSAFPNPAPQLSEIAISYPLSNEEVHITCYSMQGHLVESTSITSDTNRLRYTLPDVPSGMYLLKISSSNFLGTAKIIIK